ncbi:MAG: response regulator [bacterium]
MFNKIRSFISDMKIFYKIMVPFTFILFLSVSLISIVFIKDKSNYLFKEKRRAVESVMAIMKSYTYLLETFDYQALQSNINSLKKANKDIVYLYIADNKGKYIAGTSDDLANKEVIVPVHEDILQEAEPLVSGEDTVGRVFIGIELKDIKNEISHTRNLLLSLGVFFIFVCIVLYRIITKIAIIKPLVAFSDITNLISLGDFPKIVEIQTNDEIGSLSLSLKKMLDFLLSVKNQAYEIASGNYDIDISPRSEKDILGTALSAMKNNLAENKKKSDRQNWIKSGVAELNDKIRGEQDISSLSHNIISFLCPYLDAQIGAIYITEDNSILKMMGSYAYTKRKHLSSEYKFGESLVGEAALEKDIILISDVPEDYIKIQSGLGESSPFNIIVVPLTYENEVKGVIELGSLHEMSNLKIEFIKQITENIAISLNTAESRNKARKLLEETQRQSQVLLAQQEELKHVNEVLETQAESLKKSEARLQEQQEELRQSNEELEEQAKSLKKSESKLQEQQEELRQTNEELEEQAKLLENQKADIQKKNAELEQAQIMLTEKTKELERSSKYKSQFLANMSHELRTPLNSMLLLSNLLMKNKDGNLTSKQEEYAGTIYHAGSDLLTLINDILDLSKIEAGKMELNIETVNLENFISNIERTFTPVIQEKGLNFKIEKESGLPENIDTDRQRIEQIIKNLLSNAVKFTSKGEIALKIFRPAVAKLPKNILSSEYTLAIAVSDTGIGIPKDKQQILFDSFKQVDGSISRKYGGTGLGLAISREFSRLLDGEIQLESAEGKGSTFTLYLPFKKDISGKIDIKIEKQDEKEKKQDEVKMPGKEKKFTVSDIRDDRRNITNIKDKILLIIEDDADFAKILFELAVERGFKGLIAEDGEAGLALADQYRPDAIILDIGLPRMDGWTVMDKLKKNPRTCNIPVHFMSAYDKSLEGMKMGAIGYLTKPVTIENLNLAFKKIEDIISKNIKNLLIVENDKETKNNIIKLLKTENTVITSVGTGAEAVEVLKTAGIDCMVMGLDLKDISSFKLIEKIRDDKMIPYLPIIVYTGRELTEEEDAKLRKYAESIIVKGVKSPERLLDEAGLFLHRIEENIPEEKKKAIKILQSGENIFKNKKVLLVDDDMRNVFALSSALEERGLKIAIAKNGRESLKCLENEPDIDIVLMDIMMPEMNGYEAIEEIRKQERFKKLPIIALTAKAMPGDRKKCIDVGASDYLAKPVDIDKLLSLLKVWLYG